MKNDSEILGVSPDSQLKQIKLAYHKKLREFPAHSHPQEFKAVRQAYESLRQKQRNQKGDFFNPPPMRGEIPPEMLESLRQRVRSQVELSWDELIKLTF